MVLTLLQMPYLEIAGPIDRIHRIISKIFSEDNIITFVDYDIKLLDNSIYSNWQDDDNEYVSLMLGHKNPDIMTEEWIRYILSNRFFQIIAQVVNTTQ